MKKTYLSVILDCLFCFITTFVLLFTILNYFTKQNVSIILALTGGVLISILISKLSYSSYSKSAINKKEQDNFNNVLTNLNLLDENKLFTFFYDFLSINKNNLERKKDYILDKDKNVLYFFKFSFCETSKSDIVKAFNKLTKNQSAVIYVNFIEKDTLNFAKRFGDKITVIEDKNLYEELKRANFFPENKFTLLEDSPKQKVNIKNFLDKKRAPKFFISGLIFLALSYLVPFRIYYILCGSLMLIFSLIIIFFKRQKETN
ncbi:MAG: hypothetical protein MJ066_01450 [Clostridia bacterium]|nr:hypothetical protein [Clostridia bacterium]